ncbi:CBASS cGAMP-activated phospholipase [Thiolapillus sp.]
MRRRILSIQGGGVNGIFAARILARVEEHLERNGKPCRVGRYFDLVAGTSTGGLVALGVALEIPAADIVNLYHDKAASIFPERRRSIWAKITRQAQGKPFYDSEPLITELRSVFGEKQIGNAITRVVIPAYNQNGNRICLFKTAHHTAFQNDYHLEAWEVAAATSAAPLYFPPHRMKAAGNNATFLDGGVWANNPVLIAVAECIHYCEWNRNELDILSISGVRETVETAGWKMFRRLPEMLLHSQVQGSIATAKTLLGDVNGAQGPHGKVFDYADDIPTGTYKMDDSRSIDDLLGKADTLFKSRGDEIIGKFFSNVAEEFDPKYP